jgi:hypothetical protein
VLTDSRNKQAPQTSRHAYVHWTPRVARLFLKYTWTINAEIAQVDLPLKSVGQMVE